MTSCMLASNTFCIDVKRKRRPKKPTAHKKPEENEQNLQTACWTGTYWRKDTVVFSFHIVIKEESPSVPSVGSINTSWSNLHVQTQKKYPHSDTCITWSSNCQWCMPHYTSGPDNLGQITSEAIKPTCKCAEPQNMAHDFSWYLEGMRLRPLSNSAT